VRADLPSGTVTFLFTDVEGSTRLLHSLGAEGYAEALAEHRRLIREACAAEGGVEVDTQGDAFFFAFPTAPGALFAAHEMTAALADGPIQVRIGLHTGTPLLTEEGYVGDDVHFAARVAASGHGGQVLVSSATAALIEPSNSLLQGIFLLDLGEHRLQDIAEAVSILQLGDGRFPPLKTISNTNLPRPASSFVGREQELAEVLTLIEADARLVTLTGPGGTGKTRLALEAASALVSEYKAGVFWVGLASLRDPALVSETILQTLGAKDGLPEHIAERELLLLLDNLEQVIEAASELSQLLEACPNLTLLVTSRELLRISGEVEYPVPPLAEPEAVSLFGARSQLDPTDEISELCARLDSLPLAVELAAARCKALTPTQILERLSQRLDLLKGGRDADPRQQTLRATMEWSYELLSPEEQELFARLSVFAGGCTLEAAEEVADADLDTLQSLVEKSLLRFSEERFWMLETIREYAVERLEEVHEVDVLGRRHADWMLEWSSELDMRGHDQNQDLLSLRREMSNVRVAQAQLRTTERACERLELVARVARGMFQLGAVRESRAWLEDAISADEGCSPESRAKAYVSASLQATLSGDAEVGARYASDATKLVSPLSKPSLIGHVVLARSVAEIALGNLESAERLTNEALSHFEELGDAPLVGDLRNNLVHIAMVRGNLELARDTAELALEDARNRADRHLMALLFLNLSVIAIKSDALDEARRYLADALDLSRRHGLEDVMRHSIESAAAVAARCGASEIGATLVGATSSNRGVVDDIEQALRRETECSLRSALGAPAFEESRAAGAAMSLEDAAERAARWIGASGVAPESQSLD
jgi:predicted ATPase/class 3 adenylate cyclase